MSWYVCGEIERYNQLLEPWNDVNPAHAWPQHGLNGSLRTMVITPLGNDLPAKRIALERWLREHAPVLVAFSGGVDSAYLAVTATDFLGPGGASAALGVSASVPADVHTRAIALARDFGITLHQIATHELADPAYVANRGDRCFFCKQELWRVLIPHAERLGVKTIVDGTLTDDLREHRPGMAAGRAAGVRSPLADCGFAKRDVRDAARARGIPIWDSPAAPCLASRVAIGVAVTEDRLAMVDRAERALRALGVRGDLRVRHLGDDARIEIAPNELERWRSPQSAELLAGAVRAAGFHRVWLDRRGYRRGALNETATPDVIALA
jgi:uncharacterized protein